MARRTESQVFETEVEKALEKSIGPGFSNMTLETVLLNAPEDLASEEDLIQKIEEAGEEILSENVESPLTLDISGIHDSTVVDESVSKQLFAPKSSHRLSGGTVHDTLLPKQPLPANDDTTNSLNLESLRKRSVAQIYWSTTALSALWVTGCAFIAHQLAPFGLGSLTNIASFIASPIGLAVTAGTLVPVLMSWGFAQLIKYSKELRNIAATMKSDIQRFSEPKHISEKQAASIGQTIREEVIAMNEGIERTLERASELEAIMKGEVHNLELAYAENELRIRTLIRELSDERVAVLNHADQIQYTIKGTQGQLSDEFGLVASNIAVNVEKLSQTLCQTLQKQSEDLVQKLSCTGGSITNQLIEKLNTTTKQIQKSNKEFFHELEKNFYNFSERLRRDEEQLKTVFDKAASEAEVYISRTSEHIRIETDKTLLAVDEKFKVLDDAIVNRNDQLLHNFGEKIIQLDTRADELSAKFDTITVEAIKSFENRLQAADLSLKEHGDLIVESFISRSKVLEDNAEKLGHFLEDHVLQIDENLKNSVANIAGALTDGQDNILSVIDKSKEILKAEVKNIDSELTGLIRDRSQDFKLQLSDTLKDQIDVLVQHAENIEKVLIDNIQITDQRTEDHISNILQCTEKVQNTITQSCATTRDVLEAQAHNIDVRADALRDSLAINSFSLNEVLANQAHTLEQRMEMIHDLIAKSDTNMSTAFQRQVDFLTNAIVNNREIINETVQHHITSLESHTELLQNTLSQSNGTFFEILEKRIGSLDKDLENHAYQIFERASVLEETLSEKLGRVCESIETQTSVFEERSDNLKTFIVLNNQHNQEIQQVLETSVDTVRTTLENSVNVVSGNVRDKIAQMSDILSSTSGRVLSLLHGETDKLQENLINVSEKLETIMADQIKKSETAIRVASNQLISSFTDMTVKAENAISESGNQIVSNLEKTIHETNKKILSALAEQTDHSAQAFAMAGNNAQTLFREALHSSATEVEQLLSERFSMLHQSIQESMQELGTSLEHKISDVRGCLREVKSQTEDQISTHVKQLEELTGRLSQTAHDTTETVAHLEKSISEKLSLSVQEAEKRIHAQNETLVDALTQTKSEIMKENVYNVKAALEQLNQSVGKIHENNNVLMSTVQSVDDKFSVTADHLFQNSNKVTSDLLDSCQTLNDNIETLKGLSQGTFEKINRITNDFCDHTKGLSENIPDLEQSENAFDIMPEKKKGMFSTLSNTVVSKSDEIDQSIKHYENVLGSTFERADESTHNSKNFLQQQPNHLIHASSTHSSKEKDDTPFSTDQTFLEFSETHSGINKTIKKLPEKIQGTSKTVLHTPNAQISSLKDLENTARNSETERESPSTPIVHASAISDKNVSAHTTFGVTKKIVPPEPICPEERSKVKRNGWVSNLLEGASREDILYDEIDPAESQIKLHPTPEKSRSMNISLSSLATSILRSVNHDAIVSLWSGYQSGQTNIVVENLYTASGKIIFEIVKKKYITDVNFKRSVDQYVSDFEKLLRDISHSSGNIKSVQKYLISDTGKVYTMLAHASGRIQ